MRLATRFCVLLLLFIIGLSEISCTGGGNPYSPGPNGSGGDLPPYSDPSDAEIPTVLSGPTIGANTVSEYELQKSVPVIVRWDHGALEVGPYAYIVRQDRAQNTPYLIIPMKNVSSDSITGFTKLRGVSVFADGVEVQRYESIWAHGKMGVSAYSGQYSRSCLWPGMTGYCIQVIGGADFTDNFQVEIDSAVSSAAEFRDPYEQVYAYNYNVFGDTLEIWARAYGSYSAEVEGSWPYILLNYRGEPVLWGFTEKRNNEILNAGSITSRVEPIGYEGEADRIFVAVEYGPVYSGLSRTSASIVDRKPISQAGAPRGSDSDRLDRLHAAEARRETLHRNWFSTSGE